MFTHAVLRRRRRRDHDRIPSSYVRLTLPDYPSPPPHTPYAPYDEYPSPSPALRVTPDDEDQLSHDGVYGNGLIPRFRRRRPRDYSPRRARASITALSSLPYYDDMHLNTSLFIPIAVDPYVAFHRPSTAVAFLINALRRELYDLSVLVLPTLRAHVTPSSVPARERTALARWWSGFSVVLPRILQAARSYAAFGLHCGTTPRVLLARATGPFLASHMRLALAGGGPGARDQTVQTMFDALEMAVADLMNHGAASLLHLVARDTLCFSRAVLGWMEGLRVECVRRESMVIACRTVPRRWRVAVLRHVLCGQPFRVRPTDGPDVEAWGDIAGVSFVTEFAEHVASQRAQFDESEDGMVEVPFWEHAVVVLARWLGSREAAHMWVATMDIELAIKYDDCCRRFELVRSLNSFDGGRGGTEGPIMVFLPEVDGDDTGENDEAKESNVSD